MAQDTVLVNAWSSGTGMAGVGGSALYLGYVSAMQQLPSRLLPSPKEARAAAPQVGLGLDFKRTFLATIPWMLLYLLSFHWSDLIRF